MLHGLCVHGIRKKPLNTAVSVPAPLRGAGTAIARRYGIKNEPINDTMSTSARIPAAVRWLRP